MAARPEHGKPLRQGRAWWRWLGLALVLHGLALAALVGLGPRGAAPAGQRPGPPEPTWLELEPLVAASEARSTRPAVAEPAAAAALAAAARAGLPEARPTARGPGAPRSPEPTATDEQRAGTTDAASSHGSFGEGAAGADEAAARDAPRLGLEQLGVGPGHNPFLEPAAPGEQRQLERARLEQRLGHSLRTDLARRDQARGLGPEGPAIAALEPLVMSSATSPNTTALLRVRTDGAGRVTLVEVLEADRDGDEWQRIAERLVRALAGKTLRVPSRSSGTSLDLRVVSRVQLPSGADPGLQVDVLGATLKQGEGSKSTRVAVLSPVIRHVTLPGTNETVAVPSLAMLALAGDPVDIGAPARRLVRAHLVAMDAAPAPPGVLPRPAP